jgi:CheY-like chemotaxis protein
MLAERELPEVAAHQTVRRLLADPGSAERLDAAEPQVVIANEPVCDFTGLRVLLVDDIAINRYAGQLTLLKLGCCVTLASGGREAIAKGTEGAGYDVVLLDCQMPDVDGFAVARVLRLHEAQLGLQRTPILAVTANAMPGDRERCLEAGMDDHLAKPFDSASLSRMLLRWVQSRPSGNVARISGAGDGERGPVPHIANASA